MAGFMHQHGAPDDGTRDREAAQHLDREQIHGQRRNAGNCPDREEDQDPHIVLVVPPVKKPNRLTLVLRQVLEVQDREARRLLQEVDLGCLWGHRLFLNCCAVFHDTSS